MQTQSGSDLPRYQVVLNAYVVTCTANHSSGSTASVIGNRTRGLRDTLHSDQGTEFENRPVKEFQSRVGVQ